MDHEIKFLVKGLEVVLEAYNSKQKFTVFRRDHVEFVDNFTERIDDCVVKADDVNKNFL